MFGHFNKSLYIFPIFLAKNKDMEGGGLKSFAQRGVVFFAKQSIRKSFVMLCSHLNCTLVFFINAVLYWWRIIGFQSCSLCAEIYPGSLNLFLLLSTLGDESPYLLRSFVLQNVTFK